MRRMRAPEFVGLAHEAQRMASALTLPSRKRLELAKSLAMRPKLLLLDEVNAGLNTAEIDGALELMGRIAARGVTILIIEHLLKVVFTLCQRVLVLHHGELIADGAPDTVVKRHGDRSLPRHEIRGAAAQGRRAWLVRCSRSTTSPPATGRSRCCGAWALPWLRARSRASSAPTAPARARCCARSRGW